MAALTPVPKIQFFDANGNPLAGGKLYSYDAGTTTPRSTYTNYGGATPNANPVILDSRGEANVWLDNSLYKLKLTSATDVEIWTVDNIGGPDQATLAQLAASGGSALVGFLQAGTGAVTRTAQAKMRDIVSVKDFGAVGDGVADDTAAIQAAIDYAHTLTAGTVVDPYSPTPKTLGGCIVFFPAGDYKVSGKLSIYENCGFKGAGNRSSVIYSSYNGNIIENQPSATYDAFGMLIEDIGIIGDRTKTSQIGIALLRAWEMSMKNVLVMNCGSHGILMRQCILNTLVAVTSQRNVGAGIRITGGTVSWSDTTATNLPSNANDVFNGHFAFNDGAGIVLDNTGTGGVNQCTFYGGGCEYNYRSSAAGVGANIEVSASGYLPNTFNDMSVEDTKVLYYIYVNQTASAPTRFNNLMHIANGPSTYPLRAVKVASGTAYISLAQQNGNAYPTTNGSTAPFELTKATGAIYTLNCAGVITNGLFVCDETGATTGLQNNTRMSNYGYLYGVFNHYNDFGQAGPSFYQSGQAFPYMDFSTFYKGLMLGDGTATPDAGLRRVGADILGTMAGDSFYVEGAWNAGMLRLGAYFLWVDSTGDLRIKLGAPASDTDGTVVGTQT